MFVTRLISGIVLVAIALLVNHVGGPLLLLTMLAISLIGMFELFRAVKIREKGTNSLTTAAYAGAVLWYAAVWLGHVYGERFDHFYVSFLAAGLIILLFVYVFTYPKYHADQVMAAFFGIVYVAVCLSFIYQTRELPDGRWHVWLILLCSWGCDTSAYCVGRLFGRHKMAPVSARRNRSKARSAVSSGRLFSAESTGPASEERSARISMLSLCILWYAQSAR